MLEARNEGFVVPTAQQRQNLLVAFAKRGKVVYGKAFDIVRLSARVNLGELADVERNLGNILVFEIKSTRKDLPPDFAGYFFGLSAAEVLVAQSLRNHFKFIFVNVKTGFHIEMGLGDIFARAKGIYPTWSIMF
jgi:hypothetical protein